jgi:hypothetical protein
MAQENVAQIISKILNNSNLSVSDLKKNGFTSNQLNILSEEELKAFNSIDITQIDRFLEDADVRRENSLCNLNHG